MFDNINGLAYGIIVFAVLIGVGCIVLYNFGNAAGGTANTNIQYILTQLGQSGLSGWVPAIIAVSVGVLFLGYFGFAGGKKAR